MGVLVMDSISSTNTSVSGSASSSNSFPESLDKEQKKSSELQPANSRSTSSNAGLSETGGPNKIDAPVDVGKIDLPSEGANSIPKPANGPGDKLDAENKLPNESISTAENSGAIADEVTGRIATEQILNDARIAEDRQTLGGEDALNQAFAARGIDTSALSDESREIISQHGEAIDRVNADSTQTVEDVQTATVGNDRLNVEGVDDLQTAEGDSLIAVATTDGTIQLSTSLNASPEALKSAATEEIGERTFQDVAAAEEEAGNGPLTTSDSKGFSEGDFGNEVANGVAGIESTPEQVGEADTVTLANGEEGEGVFLVPIHVGGPAAFIGASIGFYQAFQKASPLNFAFETENKVISGYANANHFGRQAVREGIAQFNKAGKAKGGRAKKDNRRAEDGGGWSFSVTPSKKKGNFRVKVKFRPQEHNRHGDTIFGSLGGGSDRRIKQNVEIIGLHPDLGIQVYSWQYRNDDPTRYVGVMAQDLLERPDLKHAVSVAEQGEFAGYYQVDYAALGIQMNTEAAWLEQGLGSMLLKITA